MLKVFPGNVLIEQDIASEMVGGLRVISKTKRKRNKGKVIDGQGFKTGDHLLFFAQKGVIMEGKCLIEKNDIVLTFKKNGMQLHKNWILVEAEMGEKFTAAGLEVPDNHIPVKPKGEILYIGEEVVKFKVGDKILFQPERAIPALNYDLPDIKSKAIFFMRDDDTILAKL